MTSPPATRALDAASRRGAIGWRAAGWLERWLAPVPSERAALVRIAACGYATVFLLGRAVYLRRAAGLPDSSWRPLGLLGPLDAPPAPALVAALWVTTVAAGVAATVGWRSRVAVPVLAGGFLLLATYANAWGQLFHTEHLVALHLVVLAAAGTTITEAYTLDHRRAGGPRSPVVSGWPLRLMTAVTAVTYVLAGWAKLRLGGWEWLSGDALRHQVAYDNIRKELVGSVSSPIAGVALDRGWWWPPVGALTVIVELFAPLFMFSPRWRQRWVAAAWLFHVGIVAIMAIVFTYPVSGLAYASMLPVERLTERWSRRRQGQAVRSGSWHRPPRPLVDTDRPPASS